MEKSNTKLISNSKDPGYIYIVRQEFFPLGVYKIGKTTNIESTYSAYRRQGNITGKHFYFNDNMSKIETFVLNILSPYRTIREDGIKISEQVKLPFKLIEKIILYIANTEKLNNEEKVVLSRSINTLDKHRDKIPNELWDNLSRYLDTEFPSYMSVPMDIEGEDMMKIDKNNFDIFVKRYKEDKNNYEEK